LPDASARISGSRVSRPARRTLFTVHAPSLVGRRDTGRPCVRRALVGRAVRLRDKPTVPGAAHPRLNRRLRAAAPCANVRKAARELECCSGIARVAAGYVAAPAVVPRCAGTKVPGWCVRASDHRPTTDGTYCPFPFGKVIRKVRSTPRRGAPGALGASATDLRTDVDTDGGR
jgi:hypothetical protein